MRLTGDAESYPLRTNAPRPVMLKHPSLSRYAFGRRTRWPVSTIRPRLGDPSNLRRSLGAPSVTYSRIERKGRCFRDSCGTQVSHAITCLTLRASESV